MEKRKITIVSDKKTSPVTIESEATTLGELKRELDAAGINYSNSEFTEGNSALRLINDNSELPKEVKRRLTGQMTNHLVISIKTINKRLNQGGHKPTGAFHRSVVNAIVKYNPELKDMIMDKFKCNYTQVSSEPLCNFLIEKGYFKEGMPTGKIDVSNYVKSNPDYFKKSSDNKSFVKEHVVVAKPGLVPEKKAEAKPEKVEAKQKNTEADTSKIEGCSKDETGREAKSTAEMSVESIIAYLKGLGESERNDALNNINRAFVDETYSPDEIRNIIDSINL